MDKDIKMTVPTDYLYKRTKVPEVTASARKAARDQAAAAQNSAENLVKKQQSIATVRSVKDQTKKNSKRQDLERIARDHLEVHYEREEVNNVDFRELFPDNLPEKAIELQRYDQGMKDKEKDDDKMDEKIKRARANLDRVRNIATHTQPFYLMVSDIIPPPKGVQMMRQ